MHANATERQRTERRIFREFARKAHMQLQPDGISSLDPPWPDVLCTLIDGSQVCFELTEAVDPDLVKNWAFAADFKEQMTEHFEKMSADERGTLKRLFGNADLSFDFDRPVSKSRLNALLPDIFAFLLRCTEGLSGDLATDGLPKGVNRVRVPRRGSAGPGFNASGLARPVRDTTWDRLAAKFEKDYRRDHPIELLVHSLTHRLLPDPFWLEEAREFISSTIGQSPFRRVWFFDYNARVIRFVYPEQ